MCWNEDLRMQIIKDELIEIRERYGDARRSEIVHAAGDIRIEGHDCGRGSGHHHLALGLHQAYTRSQNTVCRAVGG
jgi:hypothetical protein